MIKETDLIIYKFEVKWKVYNLVGDLIKDNSKLFETKKEAHEFAKKIKLSITQDDSIFVTIKELDTNEIVRLKKKHGNVNYSRGGR